MSHRILLALCAVVLLASCGKKSPETTPAPGGAAVAEGRSFQELTVRQIMQGPGIVGTAPTAPRFSADGNTVYFNWNSPARLDSMNATGPENAYDHWLDLEKDAGTWRLDIATQAIEKLADAVADTTVPDDSAWDRARRRRAEIRKGDVYLAERDGRTRRITATVAAESAVQISPDGETVWFRSGNDLFSVAWRGGPVRQITNLALADDPEAKKPSPQRQYLIDQQKELFVEFKDRGEKKDEAEPKKVYVGEGLEINRMLVSPSGKYVALAVTRPAGGDRDPIIPLAITKSGYVETEDVRSKVGDEQESQFVLFVDLEGDSLVRLADDDKSDEMTDKKPDEKIIEPMSWSPTDDDLLVRRISGDWHDRYFMVASPRQRGADGKVAARVLDRFHDEAWVDGPSFYETGAWMPDGKAIYFISEAEKWGHLYTVSLSGRKTQLTRGAYEVHDVFLDEQRDRWFVVSNEEFPGSRRVWSMNLDGSEKKLLTPSRGDYALTFSPEMDKAVVIHSTSTMPPELYLFNPDTGALDGPLTESTTAVFRSWSWLDPERIVFRASDGVGVPAHLFRPERFGGTPNRAGVIFIHGAGYLQNVLDSWSPYYREFMFNSMLAARGYTVLNIDYRASAGYGRDCRTAIYKHMGGRDLDDIIDGARLLVSDYGVEKNRVGTYGGSYGGFLTLMAMFKYPDDVASGAALRSVTDWAHYNHWYTVRILGTPVDDPEAYRRSSPIYFADGLRGNLVILHGLRDDNVLAADDVRLSQRLIELGKENWELALHPVERHGYQRAASWTDQMTRAFKLFERTLPAAAERPEN
ncbi:MAG: prolyl oligopeptidase family serine peptidase [Candidatus Krumholzibacteria bacterium]|nr:prolyl oligopeptidase family serine peptidase [Candidatus Krumholzibacteria bacterium]MDH4337532.1 prolyl oligopeptidase family serine peptidase [Candidatus Krumholzibacteria bacterium]MDH5269941.1 prolyl oligopeptidase family serine peptidase [Candidatus Krumholzibacteria bacterium]